MSADNEMAIIEVPVHEGATKYAYYVKELRSVDESWWSEENAKVILKEFADAPCYVSEEAADDAAEKYIDELQASGGYMEYGSRYTLRIPHSPDWYGVEMKHKLE